jgi:large conductance mechanosensitive channel
MLQGFKAFLLRGNVVDMAVGIVVGAAFGTVVSAFVKDLLTPLIAAIVKQPDFGKIAFKVNGSQFMIGNFINELISFILVASAVYFAVVLPVTKLMARFSPPPPVTTKKCPECLSDIPMEAKRCAFCTSALSA